MEPQSLQNESWFASPTDGVGIRISDEYVFFKYIQLFLLIIHFTTKIKASPITPSSHHPPSLTINICFLITKEQINQPTNERTDRKNNLLSRVYTTKKLRKIFLLTIM